jgi:acetoacetyl-CoA reductase/3-oxoacyl-[acyl-carrier protein] reductase
VGSFSVDFSGEVALVTGAARGIGLAVAAALGEAGARVHGIDVEEPVEGSCFAGFHKVDLRNKAAVEETVNSVAAAEGRIDLLFNNAGITRDRALWKLELEDWDAVLDVNLSGAYRMLRAVAPHMRAAGRGRIVQTASINALRGKFGQAAYSAAKAGLIGLTRTAARELGPKGITVNAVAPGMIETAMTRDLPEDVLARSLAETATGRLGQPQDVAQVVLFLLSDAAGHVSGEVLRVDGGQLS